VSGVVLLGGIRVTVEGVTAGTKPPPDACVVNLVRQYAIVIEHLHIIKPSDMIIALHLMHIVGACLVANSD
jgi:hypothetical protein